MSSETPRGRKVKKLNVICMGLVREYDVVWGLLVLIPGVREQSPYPFTHTHTHAKIHTQTRTRHSPSPSTSALHQHTDKTNTAPTHNCVTHRTQTQSHRWARLHTPVSLQIRTDRKECIRYKHTCTSIHTHTYARTLFSELAGCLSC